MYYFKWPVKYISLDYGISYLGTLFCLKLQCITILQFLLCVDNIKGEFGHFLDEDRYIL